MPPIPISVLDAPTNLGLMPPAPGREPGVRGLPQALRSHALVERLGAVDAGAVAAPAYSAAIEPSMGVRNGAAIAAYTLELARATGALLDGRRFPLVLGGDCSVLLGPLLALRRRGRFGLVFLDGHQDLLTPQTSASKAVAGMDLALACGVGPPALTACGGIAPLVRPEDVLLWGDRSGDDAYPAPAVQPVRAAMHRAGLAEIRSRGTGAVAREGVERLRRAGVAGLWVHLDADVLDDAVMPAVDSRQPDGLSYRELGEILAAVLGSGLAVGMEVTILDPERDDPGGRAAAGLADALVEALGAAGMAARSLLPA